MSNEVPAVFEPRSAETRRDPFSMDKALRDRYAPGHFVRRYETLPFSAQGAA